MERLYFTIFISYNCKFDENGNEPTSAAIAAATESLVSIGTNAFDYSNTRGSEVDYNDRDTSHTSGLRCNDLNSNKRKKSICCENTKIILRINLFHNLKHVLHMNIDLH